MASTPSSSNGATKPSAAAGGSSAVPSPTNAFAAYLPHLTSALDALTTHAAALPDKSDISFHRTLDRGFAKDLDNASERVLKLTERLLSLVDHSQRGAQADGKAKVKPTKGRRRVLEDEDDVVDGFRQGVVGVVDGLLEDADSCLDDLRGEKKKAAIAIKPALAAAAGQKMPGPFSKSRERLPLSIFHAVDMVKPQSLFHDQVDNFSTSDVWKSSMTYKPHAMVPLGFEPPLDYELTREEEMDPSKEYWRREKEIRLRLHPYFYETKHLPYPTSMFIDSPPIQPKSFEDTPFLFVDTPEKLENMVEELKKAKEIAIDLEHHQMRSYYGFTCLMQISTREGDYVVDVLKLRREIREGRLGDVTTDPSIIKVFHGAESDIVWLQHDFGLYVVNLFDTYHASAVLDMKQRSLAALLQLYCNFEADKRYQMADWRIRPLPDAMMHYARSDTHFLLFIYDNLRNALLEQSSRPPSPDVHGNPVIEVTRRNPQQAMRDVLNRSADTALKSYERDQYDEESGKGSGGWLQASKKWLPKGAIDEEPGWVWRKLHAWRDRVARELDESPFYIMPQEMLKSLALLRGNAPILVRQIVGTRRSPIAEQRLDELVNVMKEAKEEYAKIAATRTSADEATKTKVNGAIVRSTPHESSNPKVARIIASQPVPVPDVWDAITVTPVQPEKSGKPAARSGLFGSTIKPSTSSPTPESPASIQSTRPTSGLFGSALPSGKGRARRPEVRTKAKEMSPGFAAVQKGIHVELEPKKKVDSAGNVGGEKPVAAPSASSGDAIQPEQVPFVPVNSRTTAASSGQGLSSSKINKSAEAAPSGSKAVPSMTESKPVPPTEEGVVQVKKVRKAKKRDRVGSSSVPSDAVKSGKKVKLTPEAESQDQAEGAVTSTGVSGEGKKIKSGKEKEKKQKVKVENVPDFDYSNEPNLLDQPTSGILMKEGGKKDKKKKKENTGIGAVEIPTFGKRPARDMSQPKNGNKSGTFK